MRMTKLKKWGHVNKSIWSYLRSCLFVIGLVIGLLSVPLYAATEDDKITGSDTTAGDHFGISVSISGTTAVVGADGDDDGGNDSGSAYVFDCTSFPCVQNSKLTASDAESQDYFGRSVAVSGTTAVVGALGDDDDVGGNAGSVYVFDLLTCGATCNETSKLTASDAAENDEFGYSVSISGTTTVIGAIRGDETVTNSGSAYVFDCSSFLCTQISILKASDAADGDSFGWFVAVSDTTAVIGANGDDDGDLIQVRPMYSTFPPVGYPARRLAS